MPEGWRLEHREYAVEGDELVVVEREIFAEKVRHSAVVPMMSAWTKTFEDSPGLARMPDHELGLPDGTIRLSDLVPLSARQIAHVLAGNDPSAGGCPPGCGHEHSESPKPNFRRVMPLPVREDLGPNGASVYQLAGLMNDLSAGLHGAHLLDIRAQKLLTMVKWMLSVIAHDEKIAEKVRPLAVRLTQNEIDKMEQEEKDRSAPQEPGSGTPASAVDPEPGNSKAAPSASRISALAVPPSGMDTASSSSF